MSLEVEDSTPAQETVINSVAWSDIKETDQLFRAPEIRLLLAQEQSKVDEKIQVVRELIEENDSALDDLCVALNGITELEDVDETEGTLRDTIKRVNVLTACFKNIYNSLLE